MSDNFAELRTAIDANQGPDTIKQLIEKLSPKQVYDFLLSKQNNTTTLEQLVTSKPKEIAFILLAKAQQKYFQDNNEFNWFKIFDLLEDFLLSQKHKHKKITAKRLTIKLHFLSRYKEEIDVFTLVNRPKFLAAALLLGARPKPNSSLFEYVVNSNLKSKPKKDLIAWLLDNKFIEQKSISVELFSEIIRKKSLDIAKILLKHFPSMLEDVDDKGRNFLNFCVPNAQHVRLRMFRQCWEFAVSNTSDDQIYRILTTKSSDGVILAISIVKEGIGHSSFIIPRQVMDALARLAREGKQTILEGLYNGTRNFYRNYVLKSYLIQCGMAMDVPHFTCRKDVKDLSQVLWFVKQNTSNSKKKLMMNMNAKDNTRKMEIMTLPNELLSIIIMDLKPSDLMHFAMTCKHAMEILVLKHNEVFWKEYYERNLKIGSENWQGLTYKAKFIQDTKGQCNWRKKKYTTIKLEKRAPQLMDENWLVSRTGFGTLSYWNCHTQQEVVPELHLSSYAKPLALLSTYSQGVLPPVIYTTFPFMDMPSLTIRDSNGVDHIPKNANEEITSTINFIKPIDHRILIDKEALLYNAEVDKFIPCNEANEYGFVTRFNGVSVNPFNRTFTKVSGVTGRLGVYNYEYELLTYFPYQRNYDYSILETVDEYTLFFQEYSYSGPNGYLDLRTGKILWEESHFLPIRHENQYHIAEYAVSPTRIVTRGDNTELLASFHLPSQKFEWIYQPDDNFKQGFLAPIAVNKRYLATKYNHHTVLFDYCSDL